MTVYKYHGLHDFRPVWSVPAVRSIADEYEPQSPKGLTGNQRVKNKESKSSLDMDR